MTTSDNPEQRSSNGAKVDGHADTDAPPWQRAGEENANEQTLVSGTAAGSVFADGHGGAPAYGAGAEQEERARGVAMDLGEVKRSGGPAPSALRRPGRGPRRANLQVKRFDPWSVLKLALVFGVTLFFVWLVAVGVLYIVLDGMGVWDKINGTYASLVEGTGGSAGSDPLISATTVFGVAAVVGAINIVLLSALATISSFIYNVCADLAGGLEVTLSERE